MKIPARVVTLSVYTSKIDAINFFIYGSAQIIFFAWVQSLFMAINSPKHVAAVP